VLQTRRTDETSNLIEVGLQLPGGPWPEPSSRAIVLPIFAAQHESLSGLAILGEGPRRVLDDAYRAFFDLIASQIGTAISDAKAYEAEQRRAEALAELDRAKTAFFSNISHEFRTPLALMLGPLEEMLVRANGSFTVSREELDLVHRNTLRLLKLVNTLLDFSRIEAGRIESVYEPTDLAAYTAELASVFRSAIERAGLTLSVDCPALPEPVYADREMWEKIVLNLLSNAFKFTFEGEVKVGLLWCGKRAELTVADTGVGIPEAELPHIFERFHRVRDACSRTHEGTGIGLALVEELVKLHGGEVAVESAVGRGTTFFVSIPTGTEHLPQERVGAERTMTSTAMGATPFVEEALRWLPDAEVSSQSAVAPPAPPTTGDEQRTAGKARILVADINADMRQYVQRLLPDRYTVTAVANGIAALDATQGEPPDLILADVMMPHLDGFGLLRAVRNDARLAGVPVVLLSARAGEESRVEGIEAGADDYLIKPFSARELLARMSARLEIARTNREAIERERELRKSAEEAEGMTELHELSTRLLAAAEVQPLLEEVLDASMTMLNADFGNVQLYDPETGALKIVAQRGFQQEFLDYFDRVEEGTASCGAALQRRERVVVEDIETDPLFAPHRKIVAAAGYRAVQSTPLFSRSGEPLGMISTHFHQPHRPAERELRLIDLYARQAAEMIERKRAEEDLCRSEERFRLLVESVRDYAIFALDATGHVISWNAGAEHIKGYRSEEIIGRHFSCFYLPEDLGVGKPAMELRVAAAEGRFEDEGWRIRKNGSRFWANIVITALRGPQGELAGFSKITRDLTERKQAEEKLRESERRFRLLAEAIPQHVWSCLPDGTVDYCNQRWVDYTGLMLQDIQNYGWTKCLHPADVEPVVKAWQEAKSQGKPYEMEQRMRGVDGRYRRFLSRAVPVYGERGQLMQWFGTDTDIEERKQAEEALREAQAQLAHVTRVMTLGELAASIAHKVNQPLTAVINNSNACLRWHARTQIWRRCGRRCEISSPMGNGPATSSSGFARP
jgi:PAS domain S-box-containing protein